MMRKLFRDAIAEAREKSPTSPAVALGSSVSMKLEQEMIVPLETAILAARLLLPLCRQNKKQLFRFLRRGEAVIQANNAAIIAIQS